MGEVIGHSMWQGAGPMTSRIDCNLGTPVKLEQVGADKDDETHQCDIRVVMYKTRVLVPNYTFPDKIEEYFKHCPQDAPKYHDKYSLPAFLRALTMINLRDGKDFYVQHLYKGKKTANVKLVTAKDTNNSRDRNMDDKGPPSSGSGSFDLLEIFSDDSMDKLVLDQNKGETRRHKNETVYCLELNNGKFSKYWAKIAPKGQTKNESNFHNCLIYSEYNTMRYLDEFCNCALTPQDYCLLRSQKNRLISVTSDEGQSIKNVVKEETQEMENIAVNVENVFSYCLFSHWDLANKDNIRLNENTVRVIDYEPLLDYGTNYSEFKDRFSYRYNNSFDIYKILVNVICLCKYKNDKNDKNEIFCFVDIYNGSHENIEDVKIVDRENDMESKNMMIEEVSIPKRGGIVEKIVSQLDYDDYKEKNDITVKLYLCNGASLNLECETWWLQSTFGTIDRNNAGSACGSDESDDEGSEYRSECSSDDSEDSSESND